MSEPPSHAPQPGAGAASSAPTAKSAHAPDAALGNDATELVPEALLALLQVSDSAAPVGGYAHSYGLEGLVQQGTLVDGLGLRQLLDNTLRAALASSDLVGVVQAHRAAAAGDLDRLGRLDALFSA